MKKRYKIPLIIIVFIIVVLSATYIFAQNYLNKINVVNNDEIVTVPPEEETFQNEDDLNNLNEHLNEVNPEDIGWPEISTDILDNEDVVNLLLIGQDTRGETRQRSDSMILVSLNKEDSTIKLVSFMRDLYVQIPGYSDNRMNAAYQLGGMPLLDKVFEVNFGISIDGNIEVDFESFKKLIDLVGGVDVELSQAEADFICGRDQSVLYAKPYRPDWDYIQAGLNTLNGEQALLHARNRSIGHSDYERTKRQRDVLISLFNKAKSSDISTILSLAEEGCSMIITDMNKKDILGYLFNVLMMNVDTVESYRIPQDGAYYSARVRGMAVLIPYLEECRTYLQGIL